MRGESMMIRKISKRNLKISLLFLLASLVVSQSVLAQRGGGGGDGDGSEDDFDDPGFDDNGYNQPQRETDSSNHQPNSYSPNEGGDLDDDDEGPDETLVNARVAGQQQAARAEQDLPESRASNAEVERRPDYQSGSVDSSNYPAAEERATGYQQQQQQQALAGPLGYVNPGAQYAPQFQQRFYEGQPGGLLIAGVEPSLAAYPLAGLPASQHMRYRRSTPEKDIEDEEKKTVQSGSKLMISRRKRSYSKGYIGPVYTYVKTDKHANFKWGVKHKVGKHLG